MTDMALPIDRYDPDSNWTQAVCVALDTDFGILAHPDDCASLVPLLDEIGDYFSGDMRAAHRAMKAREVEFEYESRDGNWHLKSDLSKIPEWKPGRCRE